jgi:RNA polymerase-binding transcription factor DksA
MRSIEGEARKHLLERRHLLIGLRRDVAESNSLQPVENDWPDVSAYARAAAVLEELSGSELRELREVDAALQRLKNGSYGRCECCGATIGRRRLRTIPEARNCLECELPRAQLFGVRTSEGIDWACAPGELRSRVVGGTPPPPAISPARPQFEFPME